MFGVDVILMNLYISPLLLLIDIICNAVCDFFDVKNISY